MSQTRTTRATTRVGRTRTTYRACREGCGDPIRTPGRPEMGYVTAEGVFRYVPHADIPKFKAEGWEFLPALDGTHHGEYSALMRRRG